MLSSFSNAEAFLRRHRRLVPAAGAVSGLFCALFLLWACQVWAPPAFCLFWGVCFVCAVRGLCQKPGRREGLACGALGAAFCFFTLVQNAVAGTMQFDLSFLLFWVILSALLFPILLGLCRFLTHLPAVEVPTAPAGPLWRQLALYTGVILLLWLPVFLCWGPVRLDVDSVSLLEQALEGGLNDAHPILYTLLLRLILWPFYKLGLIELGAYLFGFLQMTAVAAMLAYSLVWMRRRGAGLLAVGLGFALFGGCTMYAFQSLVVWKDPLFNGVLPLYCLFLFDTARCRAENLRQKGPLIHFVVLTLLLCFLRGNGWPIAAVVCLALCALRPARRRILTVMLPVLIAVKLITGPVYTALGLQSTMTAEAWAVPLQQLAYVASSEPEAFSPRQAETIARVIPVEAMAQNYSPITVDPVKTSSEFNAEHFGTLQGKLDLLSVWAQLLPGHWQGYLKAWLAEIAGYVSPRFDGGSYSFPYEGSNGAFGITSKDIVLGLTGWAGLRDELEARAVFFPPALMAWGLLLCGVVQLLRRRARLLLAYLPLYLVWFGLVLGAPSYMQIRYLLAFAYFIPCALFTLLASAGAAKVGIDEKAASIV